MIFLKKFIIVFISILIFITIASIILYFFIFTDKYNYENANTNLTNTEIINTNNYDISLENLPLGFSMEDAINNNYFVCGYDKNYNEEKLNTFIFNIENKIPSSLRLAFSTPEGDVILKELVLENDNIIFRAGMHSSGMRTVVSVDSFASVVCKYRRDVVCQLTPSTTTHVYSCAVRSNCTIVTVSLAQYITSPLRTAAQRLIGTSQRRCTSAVLVSRYRSRRSQTRRRCSRWRPLHPAPACT